MQTPLGKSHPPAPDDGDDLADDPGLWHTLGRSRQPPAPGAHFTHRVLREVARLEEEIPAWRRWLGRPRAFDWLAAHRRPALGAAAALVLTTAVTVRLLPTAGQPPAPGLKNVPTPEVPAAVSMLTLEGVSEGDVGVISDLDELLETDENHLWLDDAAS